MGFNLVVLEGEEEKMGFKKINTKKGQAPLARSSSDQLTINSSDDSVEISGGSKNTLDFKVTPQSIGALEAKQTVEVVNINVEGVLRHMGGTVEDRENEARLDLSKASVFKINLDKFESEVRVVLNNPQLNAKYSIVLIRDNTFLGEKEKEVWFPTAIKWLQGIKPVLENSPGSITLVELQYLGEDCFIGSFASGYKE